MAVPAATFPANSDTTISGTAVSSSFSKALRRSASGRAQLR
jgi:hypothetical protein